MSEEKDELSTSDRLANFLLGADFLLRLIIAVPWTIALWVHQYQKAKAKGERWFPKFPKSILYYEDYHQVKDLFKAYHVHNMDFGAHLEMVNGQATLLLSTLISGEQFDYADAILHRHGVIIVSPPGNKRDYTMRQPRDYGERQPAKRAPTRAKLGKTYR